MKEERELPKIMSFKSVGKAAPKSDAAPTGARYKMSELKEKGFHLFGNQRDPPPIRWLKEAEE